MIKRVEVNYRGIFQKNLGKKIGSDIVMIASRMGQRAFSNGRYSDSPERNGIPCKYFAFVSPDLSEEELEAECGAKLEIDDANISVVLDDTMCKGVEPWGWHGVRPINERVVKDGCLLVVSKKKPEELLKFIGKKPYNYRLAILDGDASLAGLWVNKDDLTHERILGGIAAIDPAVISIEAVEAYLMDRTKQKHRAEAARAAYESLRQEAKPPRVKTVTPNDGIVWTHEIPVLPKWFEMQEGAVVPAVKRGFEIGSEGTIEKCHVQARHHQDAETRGQVRPLHQVHALLGRVPGRVLRSDHGRLLRHRVPVLRRLRQMRRDLPGQRVHRDGRRAAIRGRPQPVGALEEGFQRVHHVGRREKRQGSGFLSRRNRQGHHRYSGTSDARGKDRTRQKDGGG